jgi:hypothetical protein
MFALTLRLGVNRESESPPTSGLRRGGRREARFAREVTHLAGEGHLLWRRNAEDLLQLARPPSITPVASSSPRRLGRRETEK